MATWGGEGRGGEGRGGEGRGGRYRQHGIPRMRHTHFVKNPMIRITWMMNNNIYIYRLDRYRLYRVEVCDSEEVTKMQRGSKTHRSLHGEQQA